MDYLSYFYKLLIFLTFFIGAFRYKSLSKQLKIILSFVALGCLTNIFVDVYQYFGLKNTMPIGHFYIPISFLIFALFFLSLLKDHFNQKVLIGIIVTYLIFCVINPVFIQSLFKFANITGALYAIIICMFSVLLFAKFMSEAKIEKLWSEPIVWINIGILIYHAGNFFFYILYNYSLTVSKEFAMNTVLFNWIIGILFYVMTSIGFLKTSAQVKRTGDDF